MAEVWKNLNLTKKIRYISGLEKKKSSANIKMMLSDFFLLFR